MLFGLFLGGLGLVGLCIVYWRSYDVPNQDDIFRKTVAASYVGCICSCLCGSCLIVAAWWCWHRKFALFVIALTMSIALFLVIQYLNHYIDSLTPH